MRVWKAKAVMEMRREVELMFSWRGNFNLPAHQFQVQKALSSSYSYNCYVNPDIEKSRSELSSLVTANCRLL